MEWSPPTEIGITFAQGTYRARSFKRPLSQEGFRDGHRSGQGVLSTSPRSGGGGSPSGGQRSRRAFNSASTRARPWGNPPLSAARRENSVSCSGLIAHGGHQAAPQLRELDAGGRRLSSATGRPNGDAGGSRAYPTTGPRMSCPKLCCASAAMDGRLHHRPGESDRDGAAVRRRGSARDEVRAAGAAGPNPCCFIASTRRATGR